MVRCCKFLIGHYWVSERGRQIGAVICLKLPGGDPGRRIGEGRGSMVLSSLEASMAGSFFSPGPFPYQTFCHRMKAAEKGRGSDYPLFINKPSLLRQSQRQARLFLIPKGDMVNCLKRIAFTASVLFQVADFPLCLQLL